MGLSILIVVLFSAATLPPKMLSLTYHPLLAIRCTRLLAMTIVVYSVMTAFVDWVYHGYLVGWMWCQAMAEKYEALRRLPACYMAAWKWALRSFVRNMGWRQVLIFCAGLALLGTGAIFQFLALQLLSSL
jgi:hypothetical protein